MTANPPLGIWTTPFGAAPIDRIRPEHFPPASGGGMAEQPREALWISSDLGRHAACVAELGSDESQPHQVGRIQRTYVDSFGGRVPPALRRR